MDRRTLCSRFDSTRKELSKRTHSKLLRTRNDSLCLLAIFLQYLAQLTDFLVEEVNVHLLSSNHGHSVHGSCVAIDIDLLLLLIYGRGKAYVVVCHDQALWPLLPLNV